MFSVQLGSNSPELDPQPSLNGAAGSYQLKNVGNVRFCRTWICRKLPHISLHAALRCDSAPKRHTVRKRLCSSLGILGMFSFPQTRLLWHLQIAVMPPESPPPSPITIRTNLNIITVRRNVISVKLFWWLGWTLICLVYFFSNANLCHINKFSFNTQFSSLTKQYVYLSWWVSRLYALFHSHFSHFFLSPLVFFLSDSPTTCADALPSHLFPSSPSSSPSHHPSPPSPPCPLTDGRQVRQNFPRCRGRCFSTSLFVYKLRMRAYDVRSLFTSAARHRQLLLPEPAVCQPTRTRHCLNPEIRSWAVSYLWPSSWINSVGRCFSVREKVKEFARRTLFCVTHMWGFQMRFHLLQSDMWIITCVFCFYGELTIIGCVTLHLQSDTVLNCEKLKP